MHSVIPVSLAAVLLVGCSGESGGMAASQRDAVQIARSWMTRNVPWDIASSTPTVVDERRSWLVTYSSPTGREPIVTRWC
jgi:uncharacterized protein YcfL